MNAPNLASLLNKNADEAKRPIAFNEGTYFGVIKSHEFGESSQKKTPFVQYNIELTHAHDDVDLVGYDEDGKEVELNPAGKMVNATFYLSDNALFMLKDFIKGFNIETEGRTFNELIPQPVGQPVQVELNRLPNKDGTGFFNPRNVDKCSPVA